MPRQGKARRAATTLGGQNRDRNERRSPCPAFGSNKSTRRAPTLPHTDRIGMKYSLGKKTCQRGTDVSTGASTKFFGENGFTKSQHLVSNICGLPIQMEHPVQTIYRKGHTGHGNWAFEIHVGDNTSLRRLPRSHKHETRANISPKEKT